jgi:excisionase family DNA binding protein
MSRVDRLTFVNCLATVGAMDSPPRDRHIPDLVSLTEAADILGVSRAAVHKMVAKAQLVGAQVGTTWVFRRAVVERLKPATDETPAGD